MPVTRVRTRPSAGTYSRVAYMAGITPLGRFCARLLELLAWNLVKRCLRISSQY